VVEATEPLPGARTPARRVNPLLAGCVGAALLLALVAVASYEAGTKHGNHVRALTGRAYVGAHQAAARVDGWSYGIVDSVSWVGRDGVAHEDGWPACLSPLGATVQVRFGEISVSGPQDDSWREVVWVDCRGAVRVR
jgi:hypothetical protein